MIYSLDGIDGNAFSVISYVKSAMIETGFSYDDISNYVYSATHVKTYLEMLNLSIKQIDKVNEKAELKEKK